jgi:predicted kinase
MKGHPGTGKSTLAQALARRLQWPLIDKDDAKDHICDLADGNQRAYDIMWQTTRTQLRVGLSVIVDSPLSHPDQYRRGCELAQQHGARPLVLETSLPDAVWRQRIAGRNDQSSAHKPSDWAAIRALLARYGDAWRYPISPAHFMRVETSQPVAMLVAQVAQRLEKNT